MDRHVSIIILNYNTWEDTLECLNSVVGLNYKHFDLIVVDNNSTNNSPGKIKEWAEGYYASSLTRSARKINDRDCMISDFDQKTKDQQRFALIELSSNSGYAAGNNAGIQYALSESQPDYFWILNNDTVVDKGALNALVKAIEAEDRVGLCGSVLLDYKNKNEVQSVAGRYNPLTGKISSTDAGKSPEQISMPGNTSYTISFPVGASLLVSKDFIGDVGIMTEDYFLFYEEVDWVLRGKRKNWKATIALQSLVWHKGGATMEQGSRLNDYFGTRSKLLFTRKFYFWALPFIYLFMIPFFINRILRRQFDRVWFGLRLCFNPGLPIELVLAKAKK